MKKVFFLFFALAASFVLTSCEKTASEVLNIGYIQCTNVSSDPYFVSISGPTSKTITLSSRSVQTIAVDAGSYKIDVTQKSGYILYPTKQSFTGTVKAGKTIYIVFPE